MKTFLLTLALLVLVASGELQGVTKRGLQQKLLQTIQKVTEYECFVGGVIGDTCDEVAEEFYDAYNKTDNGDTTVTCEEFQELFDVFIDCVEEVCEDVEKDPIYCAFNAELEADAEEVFVDCDLDFKCSSAGSLQASIVGLVVALIASFTL